MTKKFTFFLMAMSFFIIYTASAMAGLYDGEGYSINFHIGGSPQGNHQLDCTLILPWTSKEGPVEGKLYPVIAWANGWGGNEIAGQNEILGYLPGLVEWAVQGQFIVIAANQWSPRERDVLQGIVWLLEESEYKNFIDETKIGLAGHSQGGGAVLRASDGKPKGEGLGLKVEIATVIAMNPYGPSWNEVNPDGPVLILGGFNDTTTPPGSYLKAWQQIGANGIGGINATEMNGDHNNNAWAIPGEKPEDCNFGNYQELALEWWKIQFYNEPANRLCEILADDETWDVRYSPEFMYECP